MYDSIDMKCPEQGNPQKQKTTIGGCQGLGEVEWVWRLMGTVFLEVMEVFWRWMVVIIAQHCECPKCQGIAHFKMVWEKKIKNKK